MDVSITMSIFASRNIPRMETQDKKYKQQETEREMVSEPVTPVDCYTPTVAVRRLPDGVPHSFEEAIKDIEEGEKEFDRGEVFTHQEMMQMIWDKIENYAG